MTRDEFLNRLGELLACLPADQVKETQEFYAEAIADRMEDGMTEAEAVAAMGTPGEVAEATLDELPAVPRAIARTKRKSTALLWALAIVGSPVWIPLLLAFVAVAAAVYICIWVLALCVWIVAAAFGGAHGRAPVRRGRHHYRACSVRFGLDGNGIRFHRCGAPHGSRRLDGVQADRAPLCPLGEESRFALLERSRQ